MWIVLLDFLSGYFHEIRQFSDFIHKYYFYAHRYKLRALFDAIDMRWDWPVDVNYHEAKAYCAWRAEEEGSEVMYRIITEVRRL